MPKPDRVTAPDEQAERELRRLVDLADWPDDDSMVAAHKLLTRLAAQLAEAQGEREQIGALRLRIEREASQAAKRCKAQRKRAEKAEAQLAERERETERLRQVIRDHWSPSQADAILAATHSDSEEAG